MYFPSQTKKSGWKIFFLHRENAFPKFIAPLGLLCGKRSKNPCPSPRPHRFLVVSSKPTSTRDMIFTFILYSSQWKKLDFGTFNSFTDGLKFMSSFFQTFLNSLYNYLWKSYANDDCCESLRKSVGIHSHWWSNGYHSKITHWVVLLSLGLVSEWIIRGHTIGQGFERSPLFDKFDQIFIKFFKLPRNCFGCMLILIFFLPRGMPLIVTEMTTTADMAWWLASGDRGHPSSGNYIQLGS